MIGRFGDLVPPSPYLMFGRGLYEECGGGMGMTTRSAGFPIRVIFEIEQSPVIGGGKLNL